MRVRLGFVAAAAVVGSIVFATGCGGGDRECGAFEARCETSPGTTTCVATSNDPDNCGGCGNVCSSGVCRAGSCAVGGDGGPAGGDGGEPVGDCMPTCSSAQQCCGTGCVERSVTLGADGRSSSSFQNCNGCGVACDEMRASGCSVPTGGSAPQCMCGNFPQCTGSDICVLGSSGTFRCVSLSTDPDNCGEIGNECAEGELCSAGECVCGSTGGSCPDTQACCDGACIDVTADPANCGACGNVCGDQATSCQDGACRCGDEPACAAPVGTDLGELCCGAGTAAVCVPQDSSNCGSCGSTCDEGEGEMCVYGTTFAGTMEVCCGSALIPGFPSFCTSGGFGDGGFTFDAGSPDAGSDAGSDAGADGGV